MQIVYDKKYIIKEEKSIINNSIIELMNIDDFISILSIFLFPLMILISISFIFIFVDFFYIDFVMEFIK